MASLQYTKSSTIQTVTLGSSYTAGSGSMTLTAGNGAYLPSSGDFWLSYNDGAGTIRIFKVTARSTDTLTVTAVSGEGAGDGNISSGETLRWALSVDALDQLKADIKASAGLVLLQTQTASASATLDFTSSISSSYDVYMIQLVQLTPATSGDKFYMRVSTDGGSTYITSNDYYWGGLRSNPGGVAAIGVNATSAIGLGDIQENTSSAPGASGTYYLYAPGSGSKKTALSGQGITYDGGFNNCSVSGYYNATTAVNALRFFSGAGNIASGTIRIYGVAKT